MRNSDNKRTNASIIDLPSYEIKNFLDDVLLYESKEQKNDVSKIPSSGIADMAKNASNFPPSCEFIEINKADSK